MPTFQGEEHLHVYSLLTKPNTDKNQSIWVTEHHLASKNIQA